MPDDKFDQLGPALVRVGKEVMQVVGGEPDGIFLYVEIGDGWVGASIFKDDGDKVRYIDNEEWGLANALMDAWCLEPEGKRWTGMEYMIDGGKFDAKFQFDDLASYDGSDARREQFLDARYGSKPRVYPPMRAGAAALKPPS